jgi:hypothetical protein
VLVRSGGDGWHGTLAGERNWLELLRMAKKSKKKKKGKIGKSGEGD